MLSCVFILSQILAIGLAFPLEDIDLKNSLSENYDGDQYKFAENIDRISREADDLGVVVFDSISDETLEKICQKRDLTVYIRQEDITIDCRSLRDGKYEEQEEEKVIVKREAAETENDNLEEGSGQIDESPIQAIKTDDAGTEEKIPEVTTTEHVEHVTFAVEAQESEESTEEKVPEDTAADEVETTTVTEPVDQTPQAAENSDEKVVEPTDVKEVQQETPNEEQQKSQYQDQAPKVPDTPKLEFARKEDTGAQKGKTLNDQKENAGSEVKIGSSTEDAKNAGTSKDTTILVVLFIAVSIVGASAFGYHFIKKRKQQQSAAVEQAEKSSLKRSLQNLTTRGEPNQQEMKPLINDNNKEVEMIEIFKKENGTPEKSNSQTEVKT